MITEDQVRAAVGGVRDPELQRDLSRLDAIQSVRIDGESVTVGIQLLTPAHPYMKEIEADARARLSALPGVARVQIEMTGVVPMPYRKSNPLPGVKHVVAVGSGKGGVGKSTVAANIALSLARDGAAVGLMDADVYGPNIPTMLGVSEPKAVEEKKIRPAENYGIKIMSMGFFIDPNEPVIWRGPMLHGAMRQFLQDVEWGELDYLVVDLPPGTGDVQLSMSQMIPVSGAVIVATPQKVALEDAAKAIGMFKKVGVPLLGVVENMSYMLCPHCGESVDPFGKGGAEKAAGLWGLRFLGAIPFDPRVRMGGDSGAPIVVHHEKDAEAFRIVARRVAGEIAARQLLARAEIKLEGLVLE